MLDYVLTHSDGIVVEVIDNCKNNTPNDKNNPGNMIKIEHCCNKTPTSHKR